MNSERLKVHGSDVMEWTAGCMKYWMSEDNLERLHVVELLKSIVYDEVKLFKEYEDCWWYPIWVENRGILKEHWIETEDQVTLVSSMIMSLRRLGLVVEYMGMDIMDLREDQMDRLGVRVAEEVKHWETSGWVDYINWLPMNRLEAYYTAGIEYYLDKGLMMMSVDERMVYTGDIKFTTH